MFDGFSPSGDVAQSACDGSNDRCGRERCNVGWKRAQYLRVNLSVGCTWIAWTQRERKRAPSPPAVHHYPSGSDDADVHQHNVEPSQHVAEPAVDRNSTRLN